MATLSFIRLLFELAVLLFSNPCITYGPSESPATWRILGIPSNVPASGIPSVSCWLSACRRFAAIVSVWSVVVHRWLTGARVVGVIDSVQLRRAEASIAEAQVVR